MSITVDLSPELESRLRSQAARSGLDIEAFAAKVLERELSRNLRDIVGPAAEDAPPDMTDDALSEFLNEVIHESRRELRKLWSDAHVLR